MTRTRSRIRFVGHLLLALTMLFASGIGQTTSALAADIGLPFFGAYLNGTDATQPARAQSLGASTVTIQFNWTSFEASQTGTLNSGHAAIVDQMVANAVSRGLTPVAVVGAGPSWAAVNTYGALKHDKKAAFQTFVRNLVTRYSARGVHHWMIWPEPDAIQNPVTSADVPRGAWGDEPAWYAEVMMAASSELKSVDPSAKLILGPLAYDRFYTPKGGTWCAKTPAPFNCGATGLFNYDFIAQVMAVPGAAAAFDAVSVNAYRYYGAAWETGSSGFDIGAKVRQLRGRLTELGVDLPIVIGESGIWSGVYSGTNPDLPIIVNGQLQEGGVATRERQAAYVTQLYARARDAGVAADFWYTMDESDPVVQYGLYDDNKNAKPGVAAYQEVSRRLGGSSVRPFGAAGVVNVRSGSAERYGFMDDDHNITVVAWANNSATPSAQVFVPTGYQGYDLNGNAATPSATVSGGTLWNLDNNPVFFRGRAYRVIIPLSPHG